MTYSGVAFTHCGSGGQCGGHQHCSNYELALNDANIWRALGLGKPSGGVSKCPTSSFNSDQDCCNWNTCPGWLRSKVPSCPLDSASSTRYPVCVQSSSGKRVTAYVTGCCPSNHPCNVCKNQFGVPGGCNNWQDHADLCDNLWGALGYPSQSTTLSIQVGRCGSGPSPGPGPRPSGCTNNGPPPGSGYTCAQQKSWGKCGEPWMKGYCCSTCH